MVSSANKLTRWNSNWGREIGIQSLFFFSLTRLHFWFIIFTVDLEASDYIIFRVFTADSFGFHFSFSWRYVKEHRTFKGVLKTTLTLRAMIARFLKQWWQERWSLLCFFGITLRFDSYTVSSQNTDTCASWLTFCLEFCHSFIPVICWHWIVVHAIGTCFLSDVNTLTQVSRCTIIFYLGLKPCSNTVKTRERLVKVN